MSRRHAEIRRHRRGLLARRPGVDQRHRGERPAGGRDVAHERRRDRRGHNQAHVRASPWLNSSCSSSRWGSSSSCTCSSGASSGWPRATWRSARRAWCCARCARAGPAGPAAAGRLVVIQSPELEAGIEHRDRPRPGRGPRHGPRHPARRGRVRLRPPCPLRPRPGRRRDRGPALHQRHLRERRPPRRACAASSPATSSRSARPSSPTGPAHEPAASSTRAGVTQTGNVRRSNEDSYLMRAPLFMVADGMGGAQAGEIASRMCAEAFAQVDLIRDAAGRGAARDDPHRQRAASSSGRARDPRRRRDGDDGDRGADGRRRARSPSPTSATAAPTCCATAACSGSPTTTRWSASWCARASCPRPRPSTTPSAA